MITKNFMRYLNMIYDTPGDNISGKATFINLVGEESLVKFEDGYLGYQSNIFYDLLRDRSLRSLSSEISNNYTATGMFFGSGGGTPSSDDYCLSNPIDFSDDGLTVVSTNLVSNYNKDNLYIFTYTIKNKGTENITISESGLITVIKYAQLQINNPLFFLWARDTFDPIVMKPGETRAFTMEITL